MSNLAMLRAMRDTDLAGYSTQRAMYAADLRAGRLRALRSEAERLLRAARRRAKHDRRHPRRRGRHVVS